MQIHLESRTTSGKIMLLLCIVPLLFSGVIGQQIHEQACPTDLFPDLDKAQYAGTWYEVASLNEGLEDAMSCIKSDYQLVDDTLTGTIYEQFESFRLRKRSYSYDVRLDPKNDSLASDMKSVLLFRFSDEQFEVEAYDYKVLYTDYDNYAVVYACDAYDDMRIIYSWILSRNPTPDFYNDEAAAAVLESLQRIGVDIPEINILNIDQTDCENATDLDDSSFDYDFGFGSYGDMGDLDSEIDWSDFDLEASDFDDSDSDDSDSDDSDSDDTYVDIEVIEVDLEDSDIDLNGDQNETGDQVDDNEITDEEVA